jgi:hypothetical protein
LSKRCRLWFFGRAITAAMPCRRTNRKGIWTCEQVVPPEAIFGVNDLAIVA